MSRQHTTITLLAACSRVLAASAAAPCETGDCVHSVVLEPHNAPPVFCVGSSTPMQQELMKGKLASLFEVQRLKVVVDQTDKKSSIKLHVASEDTWLTGAFSEHGAEEQLRAAVQIASSGKLIEKVRNLRDSLASVWDSSGAEHEREFSPFMTSCVAVQTLTGSSSNITVVWSRVGPLGKSTGRTASEERLRLWSGPLLFLTGLTLFLNAGTLAESVRTQPAATKHECANTNESAVPFRSSERHNVSHRPISRRTGGLSLRVWRDDVDDALHLANRLPHLVPHWATASSSCVHSDAHCIGGVGRGCARLGSRVTCPALQRSLAVRGLHSSTACPPCCHASWMPSSLRDR